MHDPIDILRDLVKAYDTQVEGVKAYSDDSLKARVQDARKLVAQFDDSKAPDGRTRPIVLNDIEPGTVVRMLNWDGSVNAFSDSVILRSEDGYVRLCRPYLVASSTETCAPSPLTGVEDYKVSIDSLLHRFHVVLLSTGRVHKRTT